MERPAKRSEALVRPLIRDFVTHYITRFGEYPTKQVVERAIKAIIKKEQEHFIETTFSGQNWNYVDLPDVTEMVGERVMELKELEAKEVTKITAAK